MHQLNAQSNNFILLFIFENGTWADFPELGFFKYNVLAVYYEQPLPNGNTTDVRVIIKNLEGRIVVMVLEILGI